MMSQDDTTMASEHTAMQEQTLLRALARAEAGLTLAATPDEGEEHLLVWLGGAPYFVRLSDLREALPTIPPHVALPFSPPWVWGVFPLRTELVALVDPTPTLLHGPAFARQMTSADATPHAETSGSLMGQEPPRALVVGEGDHLLALVTDRIGDICLLRAEDREPPPTHAQPGAGAQSHYVTGAYRVAGLLQPALALKIAQVSEDIFAAIEERPAHE